jgi:hypothetical protein
MALPSTSWPEIYEGQLRDLARRFADPPDPAPSFESDTLGCSGSMSPAMDRAVDAAATLRPGMVTGDNDLDTLKLLAATPGSLGPTTLGLLKTTNTRMVCPFFPINGVPRLSRWTNLKNG